MYLIEGGKALITDDEHTTDKLEKVFQKKKNQKELSEEKTGCSFKVGIISKKKCNKIHSLIWFEEKKLR